MQGDERVVKEISFEEKKKFLEGKLTEEEIGEVMRRYNQAAAGGSAPQKDQVFVNVKESPAAERRLEHQQSLLMQSVNVASIAVISSLAVSYVLDKIKDRQDKNMREELKDRMESTVRDTYSRIRALESDIDAQVRSYYLNCFRKQA